MIEALHQAVRDAKKRVMNSVARAVLSAIDDTQKMQSLQIQLLDSETADDVERFQNYGFTSVPYAGAEAVAVAVGGLRSHAIVIAVDDRRYRLTGGQPGEVVMHDDQGQKIHLQRDQVLITSPNKIVVHSDAEIDFTGPKAVISTDEVDLGGTGGQAVARVGDSVDLGTGLITSGSGVVFST